MTDPTYIDSNSVDPLADIKTLSLVEIESIADDKVNVA